MSGPFALLLLLLLAATAVVADQVELKNPVLSAAEDEVKELPGLTYKLNFKHYSGYLEADDQQPTNRFWHYWFVESQSDPAKDPLVLWLNGGPGCSSLLGLLTELGPFRVGTENKIVPNPHAWNHHANVIFLESPAGVGYSYAVNGDIKADDDSTAKQNHLALKSFLRKFPQFAKRELYLTGESYAGVYLPTLAVLVDADPEMNLAGVAIGNGYLDANKLAESLIYFSYYHGLVGRSTWTGLSKNCCGGKPVARGQCQFDPDSRSAPCSDFVAKATDEIINSGVNPYNLYDRCYGSDSNSTLTRSSKAKGREHFDKRLVLDAFKFDNERPSRFASSMYEKLKGDPPCTDDSVTINYLNQPAVRAALHIPDTLKTQFTTCFDGIQYTMIYPARKGGLAPQIQSLINSKRNLTMLVYNGDVDLMCNFLGDEWFVDDLGREPIATLGPWYTRGQVSGYAKYFKGIAYFTVKGSGHMVPTDRSAEALEMFEMFLDGLKPQ